MEGSFWSPVNWDSHLLQLFPFTAYKEVTRSRSRQYLTQPSPGSDMEN